MNVEIYVRECVFFHIYCRDLKEKNNVKHHLQYFFLYLFISFWSYVITDGIRTRFLFLTYSEMRFFEQAMNKLMIALFNLAETVAIRYIGIFLEIITQISNSRIINWNLWKWSRRTKSNWNISVSKRLHLLSLYNVVRWCLQHPVKILELHACAARSILR